MTRCFAITTKGHTCCNNADEGKLLCKLHLRITDEYGLSTDECIPNKLGWENKYRHKLPTREPFSSAPKFIKRSIPEFYKFINGPYTKKDTNGFSLKQLTTISPNSQKTNWKSTTISMEYRLALRVNKNYK